MSGRLMHKQSMSARHNRVSGRHLATVVDALKSSCVQSCTMPADDTSSARMTAYRDSEGPHVSRLLHGTRRTHCTTDADEKLPA